MSAEAFKRQLAIGQENEKQIAAKLLPYLFPDHRIGWFKDCSLPDLGVDGRCLVECKWKTSSTPRNNAAGRLDTGIDVKYWRKYLRQQKDLNIPIYLVFVHKTEQLVTLDSLDKLASVQWLDVELFPKAGFRTGPRTCDWIGENQMAFWPLESLTPVDVNSLGWVWT